MDAKWLSDLEKKVAAVVGELEKLRKENASQKTKIDKLQKELKTARAESSSSSDWEAERDEVRQRVEKLSSALEELL